MIDLEKTRTVFDLELHEQMLIKEDKSINGFIEFGIDVDTYMKVTKVPDGWIYEMSGERAQAIFVHDSR